MYLGAVRLPLELLLATEISGLFVLEFIGNTDNSMKLSLLNTSYKSGSEGVEGRGENADNCN